MTKTKMAISNNPYDIFASGGEMGALMRSHNWSQTHLGAVEHWSPSLRTVISICLQSPVPMVIWWGPDLILLYNDAWKPVLGSTQHLQALGRPGREVCPEIWHIIGPQLEEVLATGTATWSHHLLFLVERHGYREESYYTHSYSPILDETGAVGGIFTVVNETTHQVICERQLRTLQNLAFQTGQAKTSEQACQAALQTLAENTADIPFAFLYLLSADGKQIQLCQTSSPEADHFANPKYIDLTQPEEENAWPLHTVIHTREMAVVENLPQKFGVLPSSPWGIPPQTALVLPLHTVGQERLLGLLIVGVSPCRPLDSDYENFFKMAASHIAMAIANTRAHEEEHKRANDNADMREYIKRSEEALRQSEARFRLMAETIEDVFWITDFRIPQILYVSPAYEKVWGRSREELYRDYTTWLQTIHPEDRERVQVVASRCRCENFVENEYRIVRPDGSIRWIRDRGFAVRDAAGRIYQVVGVAQDITEYNKSQSALRESEARFRTLADSAPVLIWMNGPHGGCQFVNKRYMEFVGKTQEELSEFNWSANLHPDDQEPYVSAYLATLKERQPFRAQFRARRVDGQYRWFESCAIPWFSPTGEFQGYIGSSFDITEMKEAQEALQLSEKRYRTLANAVSQLMWVNDSSGNIEFFNQRWQEYTGVMDLELGVGLWRDIIHPDDYQTTHATRTNAIQLGEAYEIECRLKRFDQSYRWHLARIVPLKDEQGKVLSWFGTATDIEEIKRVEVEQRFLADASAALATSFDYRITLTSVALLTVPFLADFCFFDVVLTNNQIQRIAWHRHNPEKKHWLTQVQRYIPSLDCTNHPVIRVLSSGDAIFVPKVSAEWMQSIAINPEHLQFIQETQVRSLITVPLIARDQKLGTLTLCFSSDSNRQYTPANLALAKELAQRAALALDNAQLYQQAQEVSRMKDEFLAILSHELRSPLHPILGWAQLLQTRQFDEESFKKALSIIERNARLQAQLIEDLLDVSRILQGKLSLEMTAVDLVTTIEASLETVRLAAEAKTIEIRTTLSPNVGPVLGDYARLQQVVWNLLSNAIKFTPEGGQVEIRLQQIGTQAQITVSDTGNGIKPDFLPHVFDYFRQADSTTTRQFGGLGLGLAIVRQLVELHGGTVWADSLGEGQGATFTVNLPLMKERVPEKEATNANSLDLVSGSMPLVGVKILVVDDDTDTLDFVAFVLQPFGASITKIGSTDEALQALSQIKPDILLSDIGMPNIDGYALIRQVRALEANQEKKILAIALTAYAGEINRQLALKAGFQRHIAKPAEPEELVKVIINLIQQNS